MTRRQGLLLVLASLVLAGSHPARGESPLGEATQRPTSPGKLIRTDLYGDALPEGAIARLGTVRLRHSYHTTAIAFSPDGKALASGGWILGNEDGVNVCLWDAATGQPRRAFRLDDGDWVNSLAFSPDGKTLAFGGLHGNLHLWDVGTGKPLHVIHEPDQSFEAVAFSPDGKALASGGKDGQICLWDVATGKRSRLLGKAESTVNAIAFSPDGKLLAAGAGKLIRLWPSPRIGNSAGRGSRQAPWFG